jgi:thioredoxin-related protein
MKSLLILFLSISVNSVLMAQTAESIQWMSLTEAEAASSKKPKKIMIDVYTHWCGWCKKLDATTYKDPAVVKYINENFYPVKLNAESKETIHFKGTDHTFNPSMGTNSITSLIMPPRGGYPTTTFLNEKNEVISFVPGYHNNTDMLRILTYFGDNHYLNTDWNTYISQNSASPQN